MRVVVSCALADKAQMVRVVKEMRNFFIVLSKLLEEVERALEIKLGDLDVNGFGGGRRNKRFSALDIALDHALDWVCNPVHTFISLFKFGLNVRTGLQIPSCGGNYSNANDYVGKSAVNFFLKNEYFCRGEEFEEDGMMNQLMIKLLVTEGDSN